ncbi:MAG: glutathione S-transferase [Sneathiella sp.]|nr:glutathione S-transferase [Sneathiella sp.]
MKVYEFKGFPNPARIRVALAEKGLFNETEFVHIDVPGGDHLKSEFLAKNPSGNVPVLELDDGTLISECSAITEYIDQIDGEPDLTGRTAQERAVIAMMQRKVEAGFLDAVAAFFHHATPGLGPNVEQYQNEDWGRNQLEKAVKTLHWMEEVLQNQDYIAGNSFSVADITALAGFFFAGFVDLDIPENCPNVAAYAERLKARPSVAQAA